MGTMWRDESGRLWRVLTGARISMKRPGHWALRAHVFGRDGFTCQRCETQPEGDAIPDAPYLGRAGVRVPGGHLALTRVDPSQPWRPDNCRTLCNRCACAVGMARAIRSETFYPAKRLEG